MRETLAVRANELLSSLDQRSVGAIITSPPFGGLPGRARVVDLLPEFGVAAERVLVQGGVLVMVVGSTEETPDFPFEVARRIEQDSDLTLRGWYGWQRPDLMKRDIGTHTASLDMILQFARPDDAGVRPLHPDNHLRTNAVGFDYGTGVTMPWDLAGYLVSRASDKDELVVDPFMGLGEVGVQAIAQGRRFIGGDIDATCVVLAQRRIDAAKKRGS